MRSAVGEKTVALDNGSSEELEPGVSSSGFTQLATKKLVRKIDLVLIPWLALLYLYGLESFSRGQLLIYTD